jgi:hypothetical protein
VRDAAPELPNGEFVVSYLAWRGIGVADHEARRIAHVGRSRARRAAGSGCTRDVRVVSFSSHVLGIAPVHSRVLAVICEVLILNALWVAPISAAGVACLLAAHRRAPVLWPIAGCVLVALVGAMTSAGFEFRMGAHGALTAGIGFPIRGTLGSLRVVATLVTILVPFLWFMLPKLRGAPRQAID